METKNRLVWAHGPAVCLICNENNLLFQRIQYFFQVNTFTWFRLQNEEGIVKKPHSSPVPICLTSSHSPLVCVISGLLACLSFQYFFVLMQIDKNGIYSNSPFPFYYTGCSIHHTLSCMLFSLLDVLA